MQALPIIIDLNVLEYHATAQAVGFEQRLIVMGAVLASPVAMHDDALRLLPAEQRHLQRIADQLRRHALGHGPTDNSAGIQVQHHGQIQPALFCPQVGDISRPLLVWRAGIKILSQQIVGHRQIMPTTR